MHNLPTSTATLLDKNSGKADCTNFQTNSLKIGGNMQNMILNCQLMYLSISIYHIWLLYMEHTAM